MSLATLIRHHLHPSAEKVADLRWQLALRDQELAAAREEAATLIAGLDSLPMFGPSRPENTETGQDTGTAARAVDPVISIGGRSLASGARGQELVVSRWSCADSGPLTPAEAKSVTREHINCPGDDPAVCRIKNTAMKVLEANGLLVRDTRRGFGALSATARVVPITAARK